MSIDKQIRTARKEKKLTQKELGTMLGISQQQIAQYETGKRHPKLGTLQKIAVALEVPLYQLTEMSYDLAPALNGVTVELQNMNQMEQEQVQRLLKYYTALNSSGKDKALEEVEALTKLTEYQTNVAQA